MDDSEIEELERGEVRTTENPGKKREFCKVPSDVREGQDLSLFNPIKTSIGPYHHGDCLPGEAEKKTYVDRFLKRVNKELKDFINDLATGADDLRDKYDDLDRIWLGDDNKDAFLQMMVVDGCYLLELMLQARDGEFDLSSDSDEMETYKHDILLLENQIPIRVLEVLLASIPPRVVSGIRLFLTTGRFRIRWPLEALIRNLFLLPPAPSLLLSPLHILDSYRVSLLIGELEYRSCVSALGRENKRETKPFRLRDFNIPSVMELQEAKIWITTSPTSSLMDISVTRTTLKLPKIDVDTTTKSIFYNLIMFERINSHAKDMRFSSYVYFMNRLLTKAGDCRILRLRGIISTSLGDEQVVELFDGLSKIIKFSRNVPMDAKSLSTGKQLIERYNKNLEPWQRELRGKYLRSPCEAVISVIDALYAFVLGILKAVYTVLTYLCGLTCC